jgi:hypothetical protein
MSQRVWVGPAALSFEANVRSNSDAVDAQANRLRTIAGELDQRAAGNRRTATSLDAQAAAAEAVAAASAAAASGGVIPGGAV